MKGLRGRGLGFIAAAALAAIGVGLLVSSASAVAGTVSIGSAGAEPGAQASVDLSANVGSPGLGAWTVDITYDASVVSVASCSPQQGGVCNDAYTANSVRITGASAGGLQGDNVLGSITFACGSSEGTSALTLSVSVFADATPGAPADVSYTASNGSIDCAEAAPTDTPAPEATDTPVPALPSTGMGGESSGGGMGILIAALAAAGLAAFAGFGALRVRRRRA